nr:sulfatase-like hydrolase/transferase [Puniceibacterium antarcticum]
MWRAVAAGLLLYLVLALPNTPQGFSGLPAVPLEWPVLVLGLILWPARLRGGREICLGLCLVVMLIVLLKGADIAMLSALNRPFSPVVDMFLIRAGLNVLAGSIGTPAAWLLVAGGALVFLGLAVLVFLALRSLTRLSPPLRARPALRITLVAATALAVADLGQSRGLWQLPLDPPGAALNATIATAQIARSATALSDLRDFRAAAAQDPYASSTGLFDKTGGHDIIVLFIESYGRSSFDNPLYADTHVPTLRRAESQLAKAGYAMQSGWLTSPTAGGQSWLAHGTLASGLATSDQGRYGALLASDRQNLFHLAQASGFRTAAVMPAITLPWPEGETMGFDTILAAKDLNYAGQPFNWITMPDQYTLSAFEALLPPDPRADFIQIALISSHAPWVPIPEMIDWADVGDGRVFDDWATSGDPPAVVWQDPDRVRDQYRRAIDYALQAAMEYAARRGDQPLFLILGDHQPAGFVAGIDSRDVPAHLIGPPDLVAEAAGWGWRDGLVPDGNTPVWPMEDFRDRFIRAFSREQGGI